LKKRTKKLLPLGMVDPAGICAKAEVFGFFSSKEDHSCTNCDIKFIPGSFEFDSS
jgi:hypothetical protein